MLPSLAMTFSLSTVSLLPTTSDSTRGRYFSTHGSSPSAVAAAEDGGDALDVLAVVVCLAGDLAGEEAFLLGVDVCCSVSITSSSSCTS